MIGSRGFQMVEPPCASYGPDHILRSIAAPNRAPLADETMQSAPVGPAQRSRSPPGREDGCRQLSKRACATATPPQ
jgi:hypothetical protein